MRIYAAAPIDPDVQQLLARELLRSFAPMQVLRERARRAGLAKLAEHIEKNLLPSKREVRIGDFGEALTGLAIRRVGRYTLPILKLRYKTTPNSLLQGVDLIAFRFARDKTVVAVFEVKTTTNSPASGWGSQAVTQLRKGLEERLPISLTFIESHLLQTGHTWLAGKVASVLDSDFRIIEEHLALVADAGGWNVAVLDRIEADGLATSALMAGVYLVGDLGAIVEATYDAAAKVDVIPT